MPAHTHNSTVRVHEVQGKETTHLTISLAVVHGMDANLLAQTTGSAVESGDTPHNNVQPTLILNYIIKT